MTKVETTTVPVIETKRLTLRPLRMSDAGLISLYSSDPRVARMTTRIPCPNPPEMVEAFIRSTQSNDPEEIVWAIDATKGYGAEVIGVMALHRDGELGYWLGPFFWGLGIASEALTVVVDFAIARGERRLHASVFQGNTASRRVLEKQGLIHVGEGEGHSLAHDGTVKTWQLERVIEDG